MPKKPILAIDFDGVLHSYTSGWHGADNIPDAPTEGAQEFCRQALLWFDVMIVSSRCATQAGIDAMRDWLEVYKFPPGMMLTDRKPPALVTLDDRAVTFTGTWPSVADLLTFKPWYKRGDES